MIDALLAPQTAPFAVALGVMLLIGLLEAVGMMLGATLSGLVDSVLPDIDPPDAPLELNGAGSVHGPDLDAPVVPSPVNPVIGPFTQLLGWLCVGKAPVLILLVGFLTAFGVTGLALQSAIHGALGFYLPTLLAVAAALAAALPATRALGLGVAKVMPKEETEAVSREDFIGKIATVTRGVAKRGLPTEAKLKDRHGQTHYVLVEPDIDGEELGHGAEVLLVRQVGGAFRAIVNTHAALSRGGG